MSHEIEKQIKEIMFSKKRNDNQVGIIETQTAPHTFPERTPGTLKEFKLMQKFGGPYQANDIKFLPENDERLIMDDIIKMGIVRCKRRERRKEQHQHPDPKYDEPGIITFYHGHQPINISVTQGELIEAFLNPERLHWKSLEQVKQEEAQISSKDIAIATKSRVSHKVMEAAGKLFEKLLEIAKDFKEYIDER